MVQLSQYRAGWQSWAAHTVKSSQLRPVSLSEIGPIGPIRVDPCQPRVAIVLRQGLLLFSRTQDNLFDFSVSKMLAGLEEHFAELLFSFGAGGFANIAKRAITVD